jgi:glutamine synthetase
MPRIPGSDLPQDGLNYALLEDLMEVDDFLADVDAFCRVQNIPAGAALSEFAPGQFEVNLHHVDDPLRACEHGLLLKRVIKAAALKNGLAATFMAKPFAGIPGSGLHIHVSLLDDDGNNVFAGACADGPFSDTLRHAVGGLGEVMAESMAIFAPNANSYRRYVRGTFVPCICHLPPRRGQPLPLRSHQPRLPVVFTLGVSRVQAKAGPGCERHTGCAEERGAS